MLTGCLWLQTTVAGRTFLSVQHEGAVVLDWCYDTMDNATKMDFVSGLKKVANMDAPGYPIVRAQHTHTQRERERERERESPTACRRPNPSFEFDLSADRQAVIG